MVAINLTAVLLLGHPWSTAARGDGGTLRHWERRDHFEIAVFTSPYPIVAGPVDISVLVLEADSGEPVPNAKVRVELSPLGRTGAVVRHRATSESATNKLFYAANIQLPDAGAWMVEVAVEIEGMEHVAKAHFKLEAAAGLPRWTAWWPWVCWPAPLIVLYGIHQGLVLRKTHLRPIPASITRRISAAKSG